jgi:NAD(P)-dependent dehydrogenase (short-subunit alcohol dehydrogenase family)
MKGGGSIIMNSSIASVKGFPGTTVYSASKAGPNNVPKITHHLIAL